MLPEQDARWRDELVELLPRLRRFARVVARDATLADDLVQEAVLRALAAAQKPSGPEQLAPWMFAILRNAHRTVLRRGQRVVRSASSEGRAGFGVERPVSGGQEERRDLAELAHAFDRLPPAQAEAIWLQVIEGMGYGDIASLQQVAVGTVRSRLARGRATLRRSVREPVA